MAILVGQKKMKNLKNDKIEDVAFILKKMT